MFAEVSARLRTDREDQFQAAWLEFHDWFKPRIKSIARQRKYKQFLSYEFAEGEGEQVAELVTIARGIQRGDDYSERYIVSRLQCACREAWKRLVYGSDKNRKTWHRRDKKGQFNPTYSHLGSPSIAIENDEIKLFETMEEILACCETPRDEEMVVRLRDGYTIEEIAHDRGQHPSTLRRRRDRIWQRYVERDAAYRPDRWPTGKR